MQDAFSFFSVLYTEDTIVDLTLKTQNIQLYSCTDSVVEFNEGPKLHALIAPLTSHLRVTSLLRAVSAIAIS